MKRREFIVALGGVTVTSLVPGGGRAQPPFIGQRQVRARGVLAGAAPFGLAVPDQENFARHKGLPLR